MADNPIRAALDKAAEEVLKSLKDRRSIRQVIEQCDADVQAEIGKTIATKAIAAFLYALSDVALLALLAQKDPNNGWRDTLAQAVLAAAKEDQAND
jgi:predicted RNA-binding Zn ribbon-like protein